MPVKMKTISLRVSLYSSGSELCLAGEILIYKSKSFASLLTNWPLTYLSLKRQSKPQDCEAYTQKAAFKVFTGHV